MRITRSCFIDSWTYLIDAQGESNAMFGQGSGSIWLSDVGCNGTERRLLDCLTGAVGGHICSHSEDAGVTCNTSRLLLPDRISNDNCNEGCPI